MSHAVPFGLTCEYRENPVGIDTQRPRLSWKLPTGARSQSAYEIKADGWNTGKVLSEKSVNVEWAGDALKTGDRVSWKVRVWDENGNDLGWSEPASFVMGVMNPDDWSADWIGFKGETALALEKSFVAKDDVKRATLFITAAGFYEAWLNGRRVGDKVLDPSPTQFDRRLLYSTYVLDGEVRKGENVLKVLVGYGWYKVRATAGWGFNKATWADWPRMIAELRIEYADGSAETVRSGEDWKVVSSPVIHDDIREGEVLKNDDVAEYSGYDAQRLDAPRGARLVAEAQPGAKVHEIVAPSKVVKLSDGSWMVVFPYNMAGWIRLDITGQEKGSILSIRYDERINEDFTPADPTWQLGHRVMPSQGRQVRMIDSIFCYPSSHRVLPDGAGFQTDRVICTGEDEVYEPRFTYNGFQYVWIKGWKGVLKPEAIRAKFVYTDFAKTGSFTCSDPVFNKLHEMADRSYKSNFTDGVPTDCPHREKNGWTGDASVVSELAQYSYENTAAYEKWLQDLCDAQNDAGDLPCIAPTGGWGFKWGNGPAWDSALPVIAWNLYRYRDDRRILERVYPHLRKYIEYTNTKADSDNLVSHGLGDWLSVVRSRMPPVALTSSCYWYQAQRIASIMAKELGFCEDAARFAASAEKTRESFHRRFYKGDGLYESALQCAQAMPLAFGLTPESEVPSVREKLIEAFSKADDHIDYGLLGSKHVLRQLSEAGRSDLAYKILTNPTAPSPAAWIKKGATTLWEDWHDGSSRNHIMFGDFVAWSYQYLAGIRLAADAGSCAAIPVGSNAFRRFVLAPEVIPQLDYVDASVETSYGTVRSAWRRDGVKVKFRFTVPPGTVADVRWNGKTSVCGPGEYEY